MGIPRPKDFPTLWKNLTSRVEVLERTVRTTNTPIDFPDAVVEIVAGANITVDDTDPTRPIVSSSGGGGSGVQTVTGTGQINVDNTDPVNPVVGTDTTLVESVVPGLGVAVDDSDPANPVVSMDPLYENTDMAVASGTGPIAVPLTYDPISKSARVYWNSLPQMPDQWSISGNTLVLADPDGLHSLGDEVWVWYPYLEPLAFVKDVVTNQAAIGVPVTSLNLAITGVVTGDVMLLWASRCTAPAGWTLLETQTEGATVAVRLYKRVSDGSETSVTISGPSGYLAGVLVILNGGGDVAESDSELQDPRLSTSYVPPALSSSVDVLSAALYDGSGSPPDEHITAVASGVLANLNVDNGRYGLAVALGRPVFTGTTGSPTDSLWAGITVRVA